MGKTVIRTKQGTVAGRTSGRFTEFKGIPYGKAKRFQRAEVCHWDGVLDCTEFGKKAPQNPTPYNSVSEPAENFSEDCLNLNIYTPDLNGGLPVLVYIHGGAFQTGSNQDISPVQMVEDRDFVYVSLNYRLGIFGYLYFGDILGEKYRGSGNNGLTDQLLALSWIHENIRAFGGDPEKVTLMGASAGAKSVAALMLIPESRQYFLQVLLSSGAYQSVRDVKTAAAVAQRYIDVAEVRDPEELLTMKTEELLNAQKELCSSGESTCLFGPVADGAVLPVDWTAVLYSDRYWSGRVLIGSCRNELGYYQFLDPDFLSHAPKIAEGLFGKNTQTALEDYDILCRRTCKEKGSLNEEAKKAIWSKILSDYMYRTYSSRMAKIMAENGSTVYKYSMEYAPAIHCLDQSFAFESKDGGETYRMIPDAPGREERAEFGHMIFLAYTNFIMTGDPNGAGVPEWPVYRKENPIQMFWNAESSAMEEPAGDTLDRISDQVFRLS